MKAALFHILLYGLISNFLFASVGIPVYTRYCIMSEQKMDASVEDAHACCKKNNAEAKKNKPQKHTEKGCCDVEVKWVTGIFDPSFTSFFSFQFLGYYWLVVHEMTYNFLKELSLIDTLFLFFSDTSPPGLPHKGSLLLTGKIRI